MVSGERGIGPTRTSVAWPEPQLGAVAAMTLAALTATGRCRAAAFKIFRSASSWADPMCSMSRDPDGRTARSAPPPHPTPFPPSAGTCTPAYSTGPDWCVNPLATTDKPAGQRPACASHRQACHMSGPVTAGAADVRPIWDNAAAAARHLPAGRRARRSDAKCACSSARSGSGASGPKSW